MRYKAPRGKQSQFFEINQFAGLNMAVTQTQMKQNETPYSVNFALDEQMALDKRTGYKRIFPTSLGPGKINGMHTFGKKDGTTVFLFAHGTKLYKLDGSNNPVQIYNGLADAKARFFTMNEYCFIQDGVNYLRYDGTNVVTVSSIAYIPTLKITSPPAGGGVVHEQWNLLSSGFKESFSGDALAKEFVLSIKDLDATPVTAVVDGVTIVEGSGLTVNRSIGWVYFTGPTPPAKGVDNVVITAYKTFPGMKERIQKCTLSILFGGSNDSRVFVTGNPDSPSVLWKSGLYDPTYFPEQDYIGVGKNSEKITGLALHYDTMIIFKQSMGDSKGSIWSMGYELTSSGDVTFPLKPVNDSTGCLAPESIEIIDNNPVALNRYGVFMLQGGSVRDERNVTHLSQNVEGAGGLLEEQNLESAAAIDYKGKYFLCLNKKAYILDYRSLAWYLWTNIPASCFLEKDAYLYFGSNSEGLIYRFKDPDEDGAYNDDGEPINAYWETKLLDLGVSGYYKQLDKLYISLKTGSSVKAFIVADDVVSEVSTANSGNNEIRLDLIDYSRFDYSKATYLCTTVPQQIITDIKEGRVVYTKIKLQNNNMDEKLGILGIGLLYKIQMRIK